MENATTFQPELPSTAISGPKSNESYYWDLDNDQYYNLYQQASNVAHEISNTMNISKSNNDNETSEETARSQQLLAFGLLIIPLITICGNLLVIVSVIKIRSLHSAINCLILALAVADCMVAIFVMPFAVYIEVNQSYWALGTFLCDVYCATDVTCSTASILTLTVISFDRYRAVTRPIKYSKSAHDFRRVFLFIFFVWLISLMTGSPILLLNSTSDREDTLCRFYNGDYLIGSSIVSFGIPLVILLFVYSRIFVAIRRREKWAQARKMNLAPPKGVAEKLDQGQEEALVAAWASSEASHSQNTAAQCGSARSARHSYLPDPTEKPKNDNIDQIETIEEKFFDPYPDMDEDTDSVYEDEPSFNPRASPRLSTCEELIKRAVVMSATTSILGISESRTYDSGFSKNVGAFDTLSFVDDTEDFNVERDMPPSRLEKNAPMASQSTVLAFEGQNSLSTPAALTSPLPFISPRSYTLSPTIRNHSFLDQRRQLLPIGQTGKEKDISETSFQSERSTAAETTTSEGTSGEKEKETTPHLIDERKKSWNNVRTKLRAVDTFRKLGAQDKLNTMRQSVIEMLEKRTLLAKNGQISLSSNAKASRRKSLRRKMVKSQRKEKKATKTLGIVVGVFLCCWVPFFTLNIQNAICMKLGAPSCQVGFLPFFLTTWLGYMNSFMNPIIYTTFNADFRRAFKMVLCPWRYRHRLNSHV